MESRKGSRRRLPPPQLQWEVDDEALAYYIAAARYGGKSLPESIRVEMERIDAAAKSDPVFAARLDSLTRRIEELDADGAAESFRRLSDDPPNETPGSVAEPHPAPVSRPARRTGLRKFTLAVPIAATVLLAFLFWPGNDYRDLAAIEPIKAFEVNPILLRGESSPTAAELRSRLDHARGLLEASHERMLGLIPATNEQVVREAIDELEAVRSWVHPGSPAHSAATYHLAKAHLATGNSTSALELLDESASASGPYAAAAESLAMLVEARLKGDR